MKPIVHAPNIVLNTPASTVTVFDTKLAKIIVEMRTILLATKKPKGVGLAAPQVGLSLRLFIIKPAQDEPTRVFINPNILKLSDAQEGEGKHDKLEGCLSIPKVWGKVKRALSVTLRYQDEHGATHEEEFTDFPATIIQHETDHVNGILFTQRVLEQKGKLYHTTTDREGKEVLDEIKI